MRPCPADECEDSRICHDYEAEDAKDDVARFSEACSCDAAHVEHWLRKGALAFLMLWR
jgi:hypothetical protein